MILTFRSNLFCLFAPGARNNDAKDVCPLDGYPFVLIRFVKGQRREEDWAGYDELPT